MQALPPLPSPAWILSFDFDGTLHDPAGNPPVPPAIFGRLAALRASHGTAWGINTGRSLEHLVEGMEDSGFPFLPDWVVTREREIHLAVPGGGWQPHAEWNLRCERDIAELFSCHQLLLGRIRREVEEQTGAQWLELDGDPAGVIARTEEEIEWIVGRVLECVDPASDLAWQRNSIYLRFGHRGYHKGSSLSEVSRLLGVGHANRLAIGDSHNDAGMLDGSHAGRVACPANAIAEVRELVTSAGGWVCHAAHGDGVLEALTYQFG